MKPRTTATAATEIKKSDIKEKVKAPPVRFQPLDHGCCPRRRGFLMHCHPLLSISARFGVCFKNLGDRTQLPRIRCRNCTFDDSGDLIEADAAFEKRRYRHFIAC